MAKYTAIINDLKETLDIVSEDGIISIPADGYFRPAGKCEVNVSNLETHKGLENGFRVISRSKEFTAYLIHTNEILVIRNGTFSSHVPVYVESDTGAIIVNIPKHTNGLTKVSILLQGLSRSVALINKTVLMEVMHSNGVGEYFYYVLGIYDEYLSSVGLKLTEYSNPVTV